MCNRLIPALLVSLAVIAAPAAHALDGDSGALCAIAESELAPATSREDVLDLSLAAVDAACAGAGAAACCVYLPQTEYTCTCLGGQRVRRIEKIVQCCPGLGCVDYKVISNTCTGNLCSP